MWEGLCTPRMLTGMLTGMLTNARGTIGDRKGPEGTSDGGEEQTGLRRLPPEGRHVDGPGAAAIRGAHVWSHRRMRALAACDQHGAASAAVQAVHWRAKCLRAPLLATISRGPRIAA